MSRLEAGLGLGIVSLHTLELELMSKRLVVLDVEHFPIWRDWYMVCRQRKRFSPVAKAFLEFLTTEASKELEMFQQGFEPVRS